MDPVNDLYTKAFSESNWECIKVLRDERKDGTRQFSTSAKDADAVAKESYDILLERLAKLEAENKLKGENKEAVQHIVVSTREGDESIWTMYKNVIKKAIVRGATKLTAFMAACAAIGIPLVVIMAMI